MSNDKDKDKDEDEELEAEVKKVLKENKEIEKIKAIGKNIRVSGKNGKKT